MFLTQLFPRTSARGLYSYERTGRRLTPPRRVIGAVRGIFPPCRLQGAASDSRAPFRQDPRCGNPK